MRPMTFCSAVSRMEQVLMTMRSAVLERRRLGAAGGQQRARHLLRVGGVHLAAQRPDVEARQDAVLGGELGQRGSGSWRGAGSPERGRATSRPAARPEAIGRRGCAAGASPAPAWRHRASRAASSRVPTATGTWTWACAAGVVAACRRGSRCRRWPAGPDRARTAAMAADGRARPSPGSRPRGRPGPSLTRRSMTAASSGAQGRVRQRGDAAGGADGLDGRPRSDALRRTYAGRPGLEVAVERVVDALGVAGRDQRPGDVRAAQGVDAARPTSGSRSRTGSPSPSQPLRGSARCATVGPSAAPRGAPRRRRRRGPRRSPGCAARSGRRASPRPARTSGSRRVLISTPAMRRGPPAVPRRERPAREQLAGARPACRGR